MQCPYCKKNLEKIVIQLQVQGQKLRPSIVLDVSARPLFEENGIANIAKNTSLTDGVFIVLRQKASAMREFRKKQNPVTFVTGVLCWRYLFSRAVSSQVLWAEASLTDLSRDDAGGVDNVQ